MSWARPISLIIGFQLASAAFGSSLSQEAQGAWARRDQPGQTEQAIALWEKALAEHPDDPTLLIALTKACGRAYRHADSSKVRQRWADRARRFGAEAVEHGSDNSNAYAAYGEALGQWAEAHKGVHSLSAVNQAVKTLQKAVDLNPRNAYAHMLLASFYRESPRMFSVGDKKKALKEARLAVEYGPSYAINHLVLARTLLDLGQTQEARKELEMILALQPPPDAIPETHSDQQTARELLAKIGKP